MARRAVGCYEVIWDGPKTDQIDKSNYSETQLAVLVDIWVNGFRWQLIIDIVTMIIYFKLFLESIMDEIMNRQQWSKCYSNRVNNLRFADDIDIIEQSNEKLQDTVDKLHT